MITSHDAFKSMEIAVERRDKSRDIYRILNELQELVSQDDSLSQDCIELIAPIMAIRSRLEEDYSKAIKIYNRASGGK